MSTPDDGGPAFPVLGKMSDGEPYAQHEGMTLRDWFAGQALAGMLAHPTTNPGMTWDVYAEEAYYMADAMLKARGPKS